MGTATNLWIMAKGLGRRRALTRADIFAYCETLLRSPAAPAELLDSMHNSFVRFEGMPISIVEYYRQQSLTPALDRIAAEPTWERQRARCLREMLNDAYWSTWQYVIGQAETDWGREIVLGKLRAVWPKASNEELKYYLLQNWMVYICTNAALATVATTFFRLDKTKELEIQLYQQYGRDIVLLDTSVMDMWCSMYAEDPEAAGPYLDWKDEKLNPLLQQMFHHLNATKDQIAEDAFDIARFKRVCAELDGRKEELARELRFEIAL
jgi:hypothetical protein